jgi:hypothetical protein
VLKASLRIVAISVSALVLCIAVPRAQAGPFEKFFRSLKRVFTQPNHKTSSHHAGHKRADKKAKPSEGTSTPASKPPSEDNTRPAIKARSVKASKADFPYGIPVPGRKGFVTSPFAPDSGYIDVHAFRPGTPVKDPYTGKTFLTP